MECFICGAKEEDGLKMNEVVSDTKIVSVCEDCIKHTSLPRIKSVDETEIIKAAKPQSNWRETVNRQIEERNSYKSQQQYNVTLRDIVERKMNPVLSGKNKQKPDLIKNFNWQILQARRHKRLTQMKLGNLVGENEMTIRMLERGVLPENYHPLVAKIEKTLEIQIFTEEYRKLNAESSITIHDLKEMQVTEETQVEEPYWRRVMGKFFSKKTKKEIIGDATLEIEENKVVEENMDKLINEKELNLTETEEKESQEEIQKEKKTLTPEEINALIFGNKNKTN